MGTFGKSDCFWTIRPSTALGPLCPIFYLCTTMEHDDVLQYSIRVSAENSVGEGEPSSKQTVKTLSEAPEGIIDQ